MKKIKTYEDACKKLGVDPNKLPDVSMLNEVDQKSVIAHYKLLKIAEALNEGWKPDWTNWREYKYYPWFHFPAAGFAYFDWSYAGTVSSVGSRLCFKTSALAEYAGKTFTALYREMMTGE